MAKKAASPKEGKIAAFVGRYSNPSTGAGYRGAINAFLRCMYGLDKADSDGKKVLHDYEALFNQYLEDKKRDRAGDFKKFSDCLIRESVSAQSSRQILTYAVKVLKVHGVTVPDDIIGDLKRENKGGAGTVDKVLTSKIICSALQSADIRGRAMILTLASSGLRVGELLNLSLSDIDLNADPAMITVRASNSKNKQPRYTFITNEAREAVKQYLKNRDSYIRKAEIRVAPLVKAGKKATVQPGSDLLFPVNDSTVNKIWETLLKRAGVFSRDTKSGRNQYRIHSLRKFFISQLSLKGARTLAEHLSGHMGYLDQSYRQVSPEFAAAEYKKLDEVLTVCVPEAVKQEIKSLKDTTASLKKQDTLQGESIEYLRSVNERLQAEITEIRKDQATLKDEILEEIRAERAAYFQKAETEGRVITRDDGTKEVIPGKPVIDMLKKHGAKIPESWKK